MYEVISAEYIDNYLIKFKFADHSEGIVDFSEYKKRTGLYDALKDMEFFKRFEIDKNLKTIVWENGLDIAPDTLYIKATGRYPKGLQ